MKITLSNNTFYFSIAEFTFRIHFHNTEWIYVKNSYKYAMLNQYRGFLIDRKPTIIDYSIDFLDKKKMEIIHNPIQKKYFISFYEIVNDNKIITYYQTSLFQFQLILTNILKGLLYKKNPCILLHSSAIKRNNQATLFLGQPGAGKTTVITLLRKKYPAIANDSAIIKKENDNYYFYQTHLYEKQKWITKGLQRYVLGKIFFLRKAKVNRIEKITDLDYVFSRLTKLVWPEDKEFFIKKQLESIFDFIGRHNKFYFLYFTKNKSKLIRLIETI